MNAKVLFTCILLSGVLFRQSYLVRDLLLNRETGGFTVYVLDDQVGEE